MPRQLFQPISQALDPDFAVVVNRAKKYAALAADKVVANSIDSNRYPIKEGTFESILRRRFDWCTNTRADMSATLIKEQKRRKKHAQRRWRERYTSSGNPRSSGPRPSRIHGSILRDVHRIAADPAFDTPQPAVATTQPVLTAADSVFKQLPKNYIFGDCPRLTRRIKHLSKKLDNRIPESVAAHAWLWQLVDLEPVPEPAIPLMSKVEVLIKEVICINETDPEGSYDKIRLAGLKIDHRGIVTKRKGFHVGNFEKDGAQKTYPPPNYKKFVDFDLKALGGWPRVHFTTFVLAEKDNGGLGEFVNDLIDLTRKQIAAQLDPDVGEGVEVLLSTEFDIGEAVEIAVGIVFGMIAGLFVGAIIDEIREAWEDDVFPPVSVKMPISTLAAANNMDYISQGVWGDALFEGHGGLYLMRYSYRCT